MSTPAASSGDLSQRTTELEETALYGLMVDISSLDSFPQIGLVRSSYALRVVTGHNKGLSGKEGKKNLAI